MLLDHKKKETSFVHILLVWGKERDLCCRAKVYIKELKSKINENY